MPAAGLIVSRVQGVTVASLRSPSLLSGAETEQIGQALYELVDGQACRKLLVDFRRVSAMTSQMLGVLISLDKKSRGIRGKLVLCGIRPEIMKVFKVTRLDKIFTFAGDEAEALAKLDVTPA